MRRHMMLKQSPGVATALSDSNVRANGLTGALKTRDWKTRE